VNCGDSGGVDNGDAVFEVDGLNTKSGRAGACLGWLNDMFEGEIGMCDSEWRWLNVCQPARGGARSGDLAGKTNSGLGNSSTGPEVSLVYMVEPIGGSR
jgi:hypothetical protein